MGADQAREEPGRRQQGIIQEDFVFPQQLRYPFERLRPNAASERIVPPMESVVVQTPATDHSVKVASTPFWEPRSAFRVPRQPIFI
jgi:hypothetical protein